jgi:hypothetical protein
MKRFIFILTGMLAVSSAWADTGVGALLNKINLQLKSEQWVTTQTAKVIVAVNASVTDKGIDTIQNTVLNKLKQLSNKSEWHIVSFTRYKDKSGLESVTIQAQARLPQSDLGPLRTKAKSLSRPGETFKVSSIQFTPSDKEIRAANTSLRNDIYLQAKKELDDVNKHYPGQKFYIHDINFSSSPVVVQASNKAVYRSGAMAMEVSAAPLNVGNKVNLYAQVTLASLPDAIAKKSPLIN